MKNIKSYANVLRESFEPNGITKRELSAMLDRAVFSNDVDACIKAIEMGANVDGPDTYNTGLNIPIHIAARYGYNETIEALLDNNADIDKTDYEYNGYTALHYATHAGHPKTCELLLSRGAKVDLKDDTGETPLHRASVSELGENQFNVKCIETLLKWNADIEKEDNDGDTPLMLAIWSEVPRAIVCLLKNGADIETVNNDGYTPLMNAIRKGNDEIIDLILKNGAKLDYETRWDRRDDFQYVSDLPEERPLATAIWKKDKPTAKKLIEMGAPPMKDFDDIDQIIKFFGKNVFWLVKYLPEGEEKEMLRKISRGSEMFGL